MPTEICDKCGGLVQIGSWPMCPKNGGDHELTGWRARIADLPVVIYKNGAGEVRFPGSATEPMPANYKQQGFERVEMSYHEARKFQKDFNASERFKDADKKELLHYLHEEEHREDRSDLQHAMRGMSNQGRDFAQYVIEQNNRKESTQFYSHDPGFYIEALE